MGIRPKDVDMALDYLLDYEYFSPYQENIMIIRDYILDLEENTEELHRLEKEFGY